MKKVLLIILVVLAVFALIGIIGRALEKPAAGNTVAQENVDSLIDRITKDPSVEIKDIFFDPADSSLKIAITNKNRMQEVLSPEYFNIEYNTNSYKSLDGIAIFAYREGAALRNGDYKDALNLSSRRMGKLVDDFKAKHCAGNECFPLRKYIMGTLRDPESYESKKTDVGYTLDKQLLVTNTFSSKNVLGVPVIATVEAKMDPAGNVVSAQFSEVGR